MSEGRRSPPAKETVTNVPEVTRESAPAADPTQASPVDFRGRAPRVFSAVGRMGRRGPGRANPRGMLAAKAPAGPPPPARPPRRSSTPGAKTKAKSKSAAPPTEQAPPLPQALGLAGAIREVQKTIPLERLEWDYSRRYGQIRNLSDAHVEEVKRSLAAVPPTNLVSVTVVPLDATGVRPSPPRACVWSGSCA